MSAGREFWGNLAFQRGLEEGLGRIKRVTNCVKFNAVKWLTNEFKNKFVRYSDYKYFV